MTRIPLPSPRGTNFENLHMSAPGLAHDAGIRRGRRARDEDPDGDGADDLSDAVGEMQGHLNDVISDPGALSRAHQLLERVLGAASGNGEAEDDEPDNRDLDGPRSRQPDMAGDRRSRLPTRAQVEGGGMGLDARPSRGGA
jgi:hypothetical protein